ncbi:hypothetical protein CIB93_24045 [Streptomyces sp. WZ.A104]|uniref:hypothetical protein n=1 Tax=Streptomyces sp. WZ.A104 TaxID=2023771 RepID=UPI000BBBBC7A|nr:hypothetical protein [Streptomyces sp. WZ.A104]PCG83542.1 hypothetical protein CIB93_24045 [Streptomyces sp. WZ.A104]
MTTGKKRTTRAARARRDRRTRIVACAGWATSALVLLGAFAYTSVLATVRVGLVGEHQHVRVETCEERSSSRATGNHFRCAVRSAEAQDTGRKPDSWTMRFESRPGHTAEVARAPWGQWVRLEHGALQWATSFLFPVLPLLGAGLLTAAAVRAVRPSEF